MTPPPPRSTLFPYTTLFRSLPLRGEFQRIAKAVNTMVIQLNGFASEVSRVAREVGTEGKLGGQARGPGGAGTWKDLTHNRNTDRKSNRPNTNHNQKSHTASS